MVAEKGYMLIDAIAAFAVVTLCTLVIMPMFHLLEQQKVEARHYYHASEVLVQGAKKWRTLGTEEGHYVIDGQSYQWKYENGTICVTFTDKKEEQLCASK